MLDLSEINEITIHHLGKLAEKRIERGRAEFVDYLIAAFAKANPETREKIIACLAKEVELNG